MSLSHRKNKAIKSKETGKFVTGNVIKFDVVLVEENEKEVSILNKVLSPLANIHVYESYKTLETNLKKIFIDYKTESLFFILTSFADGDVEDNINLILSEITKIVPKTKILFWSGLSKSTFMSKIPLEYQDINYIWRLGGSKKLLKWIKNTKKP